MKFGPNQNLTKSEAIVSLVNGLELKGVNPDSLKLYSDRSVIPNFALSAIATATDLNIVVNYPARDRRSPLRDITRAEISALIYHTLVAINRAKAIDSPYKLLRHLNCMSKKIKVLWGGRPARPEYTI